MRMSRLIIGLWCLSAGLAMAAEPAAAPKPSTKAKWLVDHTAVTLNGQPSTALESSPKVDLGNRDFRVGASLNAPGESDHDLGDVLSLWDSTRRVGFHLGLRNNTGCTSSQPNWRHLEFGIDAGTTPQFQDEGRPGAALLGFALCVHEGALYVSTCEPGRDQAGRVYRYDGPQKWIDMGQLDGANSVTALVSFNGHLYAGTGKYRLGGSALPNSENETRGGRVYRFVAPGEWKLVGDLDPTEAVASFANFRGRLYATSLYAPAGFFRYEADGKWTSITTPNNKRVDALGVHGGLLYASSYDSGAVYRYDGSAWTDLGLVGTGNTQTYSFAPFGGALHVGTWPSGRVFRWEKGAWQDTGRLGEELEVMAMLPYNGSFYAGSLPLAEVYRYDGDAQWVRLKQLDETPDVKYRRVWTMAAFQGRLFCTTLPSGKIWSLSTGGCVMHDRELGNGWQTVVAERKGNRVRLFVNDRQVAESAPFDAALSLPTKEMTLRVGNGPRGPFVGQLRDVWVDFAE